MAVVSRTYAHAKRRLHERDGFDFCDLTHCQVYKGVSRATVLYSSASESTQGEILRYHDKPIAAYYHACCGGQTEAGHDVWKMRRQPYLVSVVDSTGPAKKAYCSASPQYRWSATVSAHELQSIAKAGGWLRRDEYMM